MSANPAELDTLLARCLQWEDAAWTELFQTFQERVTRWLARVNYSATADDLADLRQEVFRKVVQSIHLYRDESSFESWLYRQTESIAIDDLRRRTAAKRKTDVNPVRIDAQDPAAEESTPFELPDHSNRPDHAAASADDHRLLFLALDDLGPPDSRCRQLIGLTYFGGFKYEEVAVTLGMNVKTVSAALSKCMTELRGLTARIFSGSKWRRPANESG